MADAMAEFRVWVAELADLRRVRAVLHWDQNTFMPPLGAPLRAEHLATVQRIAHERLTSERTGELLDAAEAQLAEHEPGSLEAAIVAETRRQYEKHRRIPVELAADRALAASQGYETWVRARAAGDFDAYAPVLARNFELARSYIACFDGHDDPYDVVLDDFSPGMRTSQVTELLGQMRDQLRGLIESLDGREVDVSPLHVDFPVSGQRQLVDRVLRWMGFDDAAWRIDETVHPFESSFSVTDVRLTTRYLEGYFPTGLYGAMHECGHGLYEAGIAPELQRTPLGAIRSSSIHESQSRLWENMVGRSRAFCTALTPVLVGCAGGGLDALDAETLYRAVNAVRPSTIRVEADEATYGLHIVLRFELERALLSGDLAVSELPEAWRSRMREYLGVEVRTETEGVLQDVHWSEGLIGYFPSYAIGNLIAGQLWERAHAEIPDLDAGIGAHDLRSLREWLRERVHRHGSRYSDTELLARVVGGPVTVGPFIGHLRTRLSDVYGLQLA